MIQKVLPIIAVLIIVGAGAFYGGMKYAENKSSTGDPENNFRNFQNLSSEERQQRLNQTGGSERMGNGRIGANFANGEIISKNDKSITVKLRDGGSKIVFYSNGTEVGKFVSGTVNDLEVGKTVMVNGKANSDGSMTAQSIQMRPAGESAVP